MRDERAAGRGAVPAGPRGVRQAAGRGRRRAARPAPDDHFLYARAAAAAQGGTGRAAHEAVTGEEWDLPTRYDYESHSNAEGRPDLERPVEA
ncbi:hypothetical protein AB0C76_22765 [Kitasatospora sp. NPDC048722]|uniref:hypothetical protein n=1 Tax=Kitasatospora sp. NPDC048722 TaxID=3155639 RepID=UPI0033D0DD56